MPVFSFCPERYLDDTLDKTQISLLLVLCGVKQISGGTAMSYNGYNNMNYGGYTYPASPYSNYIYPQQQPQVQPQMQQNPVNTNKLYATGIEDVRCRQLPVNSDYIFLDNDKPLVYRKTTDATGKMDIQVFKIVPYQEEEPAAVDMSQYVLREDFETLKKEIDKLRESIKPSKKAVKEEL